MTKSKGMKRPDWVWLPHQDSVLREKYPTRTIATLAELIGCTTSQVAGRVAKLGLQKPTGCMLVGRKQSSEQIEKKRAAMRALVAEGRLTPPSETAIEAMLKAARQPEVVAKRARRAGDTMRGIPQPMGGLTAKAEHNAHAKLFSVFSPDGNLFSFRNLNHFVREHPHLFAPQDVVWKGKDSNPWCRANRGLASLFKSRPRRQWKGWSAG